MSETNRERFYNLLPAIYRQRDQAQGDALHALMAGLESEFLTLEADMDALYDNWFIETCEEWVVPYLGDNVGIDGMGAKQTLFVSQRRQVANVIAYRRRKGLTAILEHVVQDVTDWYVHVAECARFLGYTQHLAHVRPEQGRLVDLHQSVALDALAGPFDTLAHTIDLRQVATAEGGTYAPKNMLKGLYIPSTIGLFIWRLQSYLLTAVPLGVVTREATAALPTACFTFDSLKRHIPLFNQPRSLKNLTEKSRAVNLPYPLSRSTLASDLNEYKVRYSQMLNDDRVPQDSAYYGPDRGLCVLLNGKPVLPAMIVSADLSHWHVPAEAPQEGHVAIDVTLGRLRLLGEHPLDKIESIEVNYCYAFSSDLGGGPYTRELPGLNTQTEPYYIYVLKGGKIETLKDALEAWNAHYARYEQLYTGQSDPPPCIGVIHILDNGVYVENDLIITMSKGSQLVIEAANGCHPIILAHGNLTIVGKLAGITLHLNGLVIDGKFAVHGSMKLGITHCTLMPHGITTQHSSVHAAPLQITIDHSIVGPLHLRHGRGTLSIQDSIIDHASGYAVNALPTEKVANIIVSLERVTVFGKVQVQAIRIVQDTLFTGPIVVNNLQDGVVRFSYVPEHSQTPHREMCQPELARLQQANISPEDITGILAQGSGEMGTAMQWQSV